MRRLGLCFLLLLSCLVHLHHPSNSSPSTHEIDGHLETSVQAPGHPNATEASSDVLAVSGATAVRGKPQATDSEGKWDRTKRNSLGNGSKISGNKGSSNARAVPLRRHPTQISGMASDGKLAFSAGRFADDSLRSTSEATEGGSSGAVAIPKQLDPVKGPAPSAVYYFAPPVVSDEPTQGVGATAETSSVSFTPESSLVGKRQSEDPQGHSETALLVGRPLGMSDGGGPATAAGGAAAVQTGETAGGGEKSRKNTTQAAPLTCADLPCGEGQLTCDGPVRGRFLCTCRVGFVLQRWGGEALCVSSSKSSSSRSSSRVQGEGRASQGSKWTVVFAVVGAVIGLLLLSLLVWGGLSWVKTRRASVSKSVKEEFSSLIDQESSFSTRSLNSRRSRHRHSGRQEEEEDSFESQSGDTEDEKEEEAYHLTI
ncbi:hypothetical protein, conserved [Eimeria maxima]|uniref:EGF-like domain-containing protein n=1 Tax=Eimeria maxima TaxID=5804 RepID=U6LZJ1_EIMMA|nr:hypothetical protein, conserved [Eimeria maxima]CDJ56273.1 hypothetical protein, conserved [Eimeria maxima]